MDILQKIDAIDAKIDKLEAARFSAKAERERIYKLLIAARQTESSIWTEIQTQRSERRVLSSQYHKAKMLHGSGKMLYELILELVCDYFEIDKLFLLSRTRKMQATYPRHCLCWALRQFPEFTNQDIARLIKRDHSTVFNSISVIQGYIDIGDKNYTTFAQYLESKKLELKTNAVAKSNEPAVALP